MKTLTRIVKYESQVIKSNPVTDILNSSMLMLEFSPELLFITGVSCVSTFSNLTQSKRMMTQQIHSANYKHFQKTQKVF